jgi:hypothetical protein
METTRRSMIATMALAPVAVVAPAAAASVQDRSGWTQSVRAYREVSAEWSAHPFGRITGDHPQYDQLERENDAYMHRHIAALDALLSTPPPDHTANSD